MGQAGEKWDKEWGEVGKIKLSGRDVTTVPDSRLAGQEVPGRSRQSHMGQCQFKSVSRQV